MNIKLIFKCIFVFFLTLILIGLVYIIIDKAGTGTGIYDPLKIVDYKIEDKTETCDDALELIYSDDKYNYYLPCMKSENISLVWDDGVVDSLSHALEFQKVDIDSLESHGLDIVKNEK